MGFHSYSCGIPPLVAKRVQNYKKSRSSEQDFQTIFRSACVKIYNSQNYREIAFFQYLDSVNVNESTSDYLITILRPFLM